MSNWTNGKQKLSNLTTRSVKPCVRRTKENKESEQHQYLSWQEWQGSNLRPPVLETGALPIELHSCEDLASPLTRAVSSIGRRRMARAKRPADLLIGSDGRLAF
jgi:hypothetical protein